jgi:hypothetical protein
MTDRPTTGIESDGSDIFVVIDGVRIAKRGHPGTPQARTWVSLEPGWHVEGLEELTITRDGVSLH